MEDRKLAGGRPKAAENEVEKGLLVLYNIRHRLQTGRHNRNLTKNMKRNVNDQIHCYRYDHDSGILYKVDKKEETRFVEVLLTKEKKKQAFDEAHQGHVGHNQTQLNIKKKYYWKHIVSEVKELLQQCEGCQRPDKTQPAAPKVIPVRSQSAFQNVVIDVIGMTQQTTDGHFFVVSMTCLYSKWMELYPLKTRTGPDVALCLQKFILRHGAPGVFLADQGREFCNEINRSLAEMYGVKNMVTRARHAQTRGKSDHKKHLQELQERLQGLVSDTQDDWHEYLDEVAHSFNHSARPDSAHSPYYILYGTQPRSVQQMMTYSREVVLEIEKDEPDDVIMQEPIIKREVETEDIEMEVYQEESTDKKEPRVVQNTQQNGQQLGTLKPLKHSQESNNTSSKVEIDSQFKTPVFVAPKHSKKTASITGTDSQFKTPLIVVPVKSQGSNNTALQTDADSQFKAPVIITPLRSQESGYTASKVGTDSYLQAPSFVDPERSHEWGKISQTLTNLEFKLPPAFSSQERRDDQSVT